MHGTLYVGTTVDHAVEFLVGIALYVPCRSLLFQCTVEAMAHGLAHCQLFFGNDRQLPELTVLQMRHNVT